MQTEGTVLPAGARPAGRPVLLPLIQVVSIACLSLVPLVASADALVWAIAGLLRLPAKLWIGADIVVSLALLALAVPVLVGVYRHERETMIEESARR